MSVSYEFETLKFGFISHFPQLTTKDLTKHLLYLLKCLRITGEIAKTHEKSGDLLSLTKLLGFGIDRNCIGFRHLIPSP